VGSFPPATQQKIFDKLADAYAPDRQDNAKAVETIKSIMSVFPEVDEWLHDPFTELDSPAHANAEKVSNLLLKSLSDYFTQVAAVAPDKAADVFITAAAEFNRAPVYYTNVARDQGWEADEIEPETEWLLGEAFDSISHGIASDAKAIEVAARIRDADGVSKEVRKYAGKAVKQWQRLPGNG
jgi:hypothetical protein